MNSCILLTSDGSIEKVELDHRNLRDYFGDDITFVGAIDDCEAVAVGKRNCTEKQNTLCVDETMFDVPVFGNVLLIGSDKHGQAFDLNYDRIIKFLK